MVHWEDFVRYISAGSFGKVGLVVPVCRDCCSEYLEKEAGRVILVDLSAIQYSRRNQMGGLGLSVNSSRDWPSDLRHGWTFQGAEVALGYPDLVQKHLSSVG